MPPGALVLQYGGFFDGFYLETSSSKILTYLNPLSLIVIGQSIFMAFSTNN